MGRKIGCHRDGIPEEVKSELYDVQKIHGSSYAFAAIRADGQVFWSEFSDRWEGSCHG